MTLEHSDQRTSSRILHNDYWYAQLFIQETLAEPIRIGATDPENPTFTEVDICFSQAIIAELASPHVVIDVANRHLTLQADFDNTYLNGWKLEPNRPKPFEDGAVLVIGPIDILLQLCSKAQLGSRRTHLVTLGRMDGEFDRADIHSLVRLVWVPELARHYPDWIVQRAHSVIRVTGLSLAAAVRIVLEAEGLGPTGQPPG